MRAAQRATTMGALALMICLAGGATAAAQAGQWGQYYAPQWGRYGQGVWGQYNGNLGSTWQYDRTLAPTEPQGSILQPNQVGSAFENPRTGSGLFRPADTRFRGRDRP